MNDHLSIETPYSTARRYVDAELRGDVTAAEMAWLHAHPMLWLRILTSIKREVENHIAKDKRSITESKPLPGEDNREWLRVRAQYDRRVTNRLHFNELVKGRIEQVKTLFSVESAVDRMLVGDVIADMVALADMADAGLLDAVARKSQFLAEKWVDRFGQRATGSTAPIVEDPVTIVELRDDFGEVKLTVRSERNHEDGQESDPPYAELDVRVQRDGLALTFETSLDERQADALAMGVQSAIGVARRKAAQRGYYEWLALQPLNHDEAV